jgi:predicted dehydrogenase
MNDRRKPYRVAVLGNCCTHGEFVVAALRAEPDAELVAGWEPDPRRAPALAGLLGRELAPAGESLLDDPGVDVVAIACTPGDKARWVELAAAAGKHVFLNKPFCDSLDSARRIEAAVDRHRVQLVHDIVVMRFDPVLAKVLAEVRQERYGPPLHHAHSFAMTFSGDFPLAELWPERLDPPSQSGGGELTNLGCYAVDYMTALWGAPISVQAKRATTWDAYEDAGVESFGQIVADYGTFFAVLAAGKQQLRALASMDLAEALTPRNWHNVLELQFADSNLAVLRANELVVRDGTVLSVDEYLDGFRCSTPFQQLVEAIETCAPPDSGARAGRRGVEVTMAAYRSISTGGVTVPLPLEDGRNPLVHTPQSPINRPEEPAR